MSPTSTRRMPKNRDEQLALVAAAKAEQIAADEWAANGRVGEQPGSAAILDLWERSKDFAFRRHAQYGGASGDAEDLEMESFLGFLRALRDFDPSRCVCWLTYCGWKFRQASQSYMDQVSFSAASYRQAAKINTAIRRRRRELAQPELADDEILLTLGLPKATVTTYQKAVAVQRRPAFGSENIELVVDHRPSAFDEDLEKETTQRQLIAEAMETLTDRERQVLAGRLAELTLGEVGRSLGISKERTRQIEQNAKAKLLKYCQADEPARKIFRSEKQRLAKTTA